MQSPQDQTQIKRVQSAAASKPIERSFYPLISGSAWHLKTQESIKSQIGSVDSEAELPNRNTAQRGVDDYALLWLKVRGKDKRREVAPTKALA